MAFVPIRNPRRQTTGYKAGKFFNEVLTGVKSGLEGREERKRRAEEKALKEAAAKRSAYESDREHAMRVREAERRDKALQADIEQGKASLAETARSNRASENIAATNAEANLLRAKGDSGGSGASSYTQYLNHIRGRYGVNESGEPTGAPPGGDAMSSLKFFERTLRDVRDKYPELSPSDQAIEAALNTYGVSVKGTRAGFDNPSKLSENERTELLYLLAAATGHWSRYVDWGTVIPPPPSSKEGKSLLLRAKDYLGYYLEGFGGGGGGADTTSVQDDPIAGEDDPFKVWRE